MKVVIDLSFLDPIISLLVRAYASVALVWVGFQIRTCAMEAPFYGELLRKKRRLEMKR